MSVKLSWARSLEADIASYVLERSGNVSGPWSVLTTIPHAIPGAHWDATAQLFSYEDMTGTEANYYRLIAVDQSNNRSVPSIPFQPVSTAPALTNVVKVDHNYGEPGALRYQTASGIPIEAAVVRIYKKTEFDLGNTDAPIAVTMTNAHGNWVNPVSLPTGFTYVVQFFKESLYGPDKTEIVV